MNNKQKKALKAKFSDGLGSSGMMGSTLFEWYDAKHRPPSADEVAFIDSIPVGSCPRCGSENVRRDGRSKKTGLIAREFKDCGKKFGPLAGTVFDLRKIPLSEWIEFLARLFQFHSVKTAPLDKRNADSTGRHWLSKVFAVAEGMQEGVSLSGNVWIDKTYFPKWHSESETRGGKIIAKESKIIHYGDKSHNALIDAMGLSSEVHGTDETKGLADSENPMEPVNEIHRYLSGFVGSHRGFSRDGLQDWLNLFCFYRNAPGNAFQKAQAFIELALKKRKILRYRSLGKAKNSDKY